MRSVFVLIPFLIAGCATPNPVARNPIVPTGSIPRTEGSIAVTRYELGTYRYPRETSGSTDPVVFRVTRISNHLIPTAADPRAVHVPSHIAPLPPSAELDAELGAQRDITARIRASQETIVGLERQMRTQYETLVAQTATTVQLRRQLEADRARLHQVEGQPRDETGSIAPSSPVVPDRAPVTGSEPKTEW